jgi:hypothetical protein
MENKIGLAKIYQQLLGELALLSVAGCAQGAMA